MHVRQLALVTVLAAGVIAGCDTMKMPSMPGTPTAPNAPTMPKGPAMPGAQAAPTAPAMPGAPTAPAMPGMPAGMQSPVILGNAMSAALSAASEVPPNASSGSGAATITLDGTRLTWSISYSGLSGPVTGAHFHGPAAAGSNSGVVLPFAGSLGSPITGTQQLTLAQIAQLRAGLWYVNLHTAANPGGEIRGQVK
jgi:CHRD domain